MSALDAKNLALRDLEAFDPYAREGGEKRRFLCPFPVCADKPKDAGHRSLEVRMADGVWHCHRCHEKGKLVEFRSGVSGLSPKEAKRAALNAAFAIRPVAPSPIDEEDIQDGPTETAMAAWVEAFSGSAASAYLEARGIPEEIAIAHGCGQMLWRERRPNSGTEMGIEAWRSWLCAAFPVRTQLGTLVAVNGRAIGPCDPADKQRTRGPKRLGVFNPAALGRDQVILVESAVNALSLAVCGFPAAATIGTSGPAWLSHALAFQRVVIAYDADEAGDRGAERLAENLTMAGPIHRLLPPAPHNDWNDALLAMGCDSLADWLRTNLPHTSPTGNGARS